VKREELIFNTPEQVREYLDEALAILAERELPLELQAAVLPTLVDKIAGKQINFTQAAPIGMPAMAIPSLRRQ
jgi:hypothetical protein